MGFRRLEVCAHCWKGSCAANQRVLAERPKKGDTSKCRTCHDTWHAVVVVQLNAASKWVEVRPRPKDRDLSRYKLCDFQTAQNSCPKGAHCAFAHSQEELEDWLRDKDVEGSDSAGRHSSSSTFVRIRKPNPQRSKLCRNFLLGICTNETCARPHRFTLCERFQNTGTCADDAECPKAHSDKELTTWNNWLARSPAAVLAEAIMSTSKTYSGTSATPVLTSISQDMRISCQVCDIAFATGKQLQSHCKSQQHLDRSRSSSKRAADAPDTAAIRPRPRNVYGDYCMCRFVAAGRTCDFGPDACTFAHSQAELDEWRKERQEETELPDSPTRRKKSERSNPYEKLSALESLVQTFSDYDIKVTGEEGCLISITEASNQPLVIQKDNVGSFSWTLRISPTSTPTVVKHLALIGMSSLSCTIQSISAPVQCQFPTFAADTDLTLSDDHSFIDVVVQLTPPGVGYFSQVMAVALDDQLVTCFFSANIVPLAQRSHLYSYAEAQLSTIRHSIVPQSALATTPERCEHLRPLPSINALNSLPEIPLSPRVQDATEAELLCIATENVYDIAPPRPRRKRTTSVQSDSSTASASAPTVVDEAEQFPTGQLFRSHAIDQITAAFLLKKQLIESIGVQSTQILHQENVTIQGGRREPRPEEAFYCITAAAVVACLCPVLAVGDMATIVHRPQQGSHRNASSIQALIASISSRRILFCVPSGAHSALGDSPTVEITFQASRVPVLASIAALKRVHLRSLIPGTSKKLTLTKLKETISSSFRDAQLTPSQTHAIRVALSAKYVHGMIPIIGSAPVTVDRTALELTRHLARRSERHILLCVASERTADGFYKNLLTNKPKKTKYRVVRLYSEHVCHSPESGANSVNVDGAGHVVPPAPSMLTEANIIVTTYAAVSYMVAMETPTSAPLLQSVVEKPLTHLVLDQTCMCVEADVLPVLSLCSTTTNTAVLGNPLAMPVPLLPRTGQGLPGRSLISRLTATMTSLSVLETPGISPHLLQMRYFLEQTKNPKATLTRAEAVGQLDPPGTGESSLNVAQHPVSALVVPSTTSRHCWSPLSGLCVEKASSPPKTICVPLRSNDCEAAAAFAQLENILDNWPTNWQPIEPQTIAIITPEPFQAIKLRALLLNTPYVKVNIHTTLDVYIPQYRLVIFSPTLPSPKTSAALPVSTVTMEAEFFSAVCRATSFFVALCDPSAMLANSLSPDNGEEGDEDADDTLTVPDTAVALSFFKYVTHFTKANKTPTLESLASRLDPTYLLKLEHLARTVHKVLPITLLGDMAELDSPACETGASSVSESPWPSASPIPSHPFSGLDSTHTTSPDVSSAVLATAGNPTTATGIGAASASASASASSSYQQQQQHLQQPLAGVSSIPEGFPVMDDSQQSSLERMPWEDHVDASEGASSAPTYTSLWSASTAQSKPSSDPLGVTDSVHSVFSTGGGSPPHSNDSGAFKSFAHLTMSEVPEFIPSNPPSPMSGPNGTPHGSALSDATSPGHLHSWSPATNVAHHSTYATRNPSSLDRASSSFDPSVHTDQALSSTTTPFHPISQAKWDACAAQISVGLPNCTSTQELRQVVFNSLADVIESEMRNTAVAQCVNQLVSSLTNVHAPYLRSGHSLFNHLCSLYTSAQGQQHRARSLPSSAKHNAAPSSTGFPSESLGGWRATSSSVGSLPSVDSSTAHNTFFRDARNELNKQLQSISNLSALCHNFSTSQASGLSSQEQSFVTAQLQLVRSHERDVRQQLQSLTHIESSSSTTSSRHLFQARSASQPHPAHQHHEHSVHTGDGAGYGEARRSRSFSSNSTWQQQRRGHQTYSRHPQQQQPHQPQHQQQHQQQQQQSQPRHQSRYHVQSQFQQQQSQQPNASSLPLALQSDGYPGVSSPASSSWSQWGLSGSGLTSSREATANNDFDFHSAPSMDPHDTRGRTQSDSHVPQPWSNTPW
eukprot:m.255352 g.255352  ORF g.255352 m.255352 type:complete len:1942 (+) comp15498_c0_seq2:461-6286(+)